MNWRNFFIFLAIAFALSIGLYFLFPPVDAYMQIPQGGTIYMGETVDLSQTLSWPDYTIVWCEGGDAGCMPPDQVIQITDHMYSVYIDPAKFNIGHYYRWDGHWNRGENQDAFTIINGQRPTPVPTVNVTPVVTPTLNYTYVPEASPTSFLIARGDNPRMNINYPAYSYSKNAHMWLFGGAANAQTMLDVPMKKGEGDNYYYDWTVENTSSLGAGLYTGDIQFDGNNNIHDVYWDKVGHVLDTPYDRNINNAVAVNERNPSNVKWEFENLVHNGTYIDDPLLAFNISFVDPQISIIDVTQTAISLQIFGTTTWSEGTVITMKLDPDNYALAEDVRKHTWQVTAVGNLSGIRTFYKEVPIDMKEMYIGMHEIKATVDKNKYVTDQYYNLRIRGEFIQPDPTPELQKYAVDINGTRIGWNPLKENATPTPTPEPVKVVYVYVTITPNGTSIQEKMNESLMNVTSNVTMNETVVVTKTTSVPIANETLPTIALEPLLVLVAVGGLVCMRKH